MMTEQFQQYAEKHGYTLGTDAAEVVAAIAEKRDVYGKGYCPCVPVYQHSKDVVCPCKSFRVDHTCQCGLFVLT